MQIDETKLKLLVTGLISADEDQTQKTWTNFHHTSSLCSASLDLPELDF